MQSLRDRRRFFNMTNAQLKGLGTPEIIVQIVVYIHADAAVQVLSAAGDTLAGGVGESLGDCYLPLCGKPFAEAPHRLIRYPAGAV